MTAPSEARPPSEHRAPSGAPLGMDWPGLMWAGLHGLGLKPSEFWALSPAELALMLGIEAARPPLTRARLAELAARWPDPPRAGAQTAASAPSCARSNDGEHHGRV